MAQGILFLSLLPVSSKNEIFGSENVFPKQFCRVFLWWQLERGAFSEQEMTRTLHGCAV